MAYCVVRISLTFGLIFWLSTWSIKFWQFGASKTNLAAFVPLWSSVFSLLLIRIFNLPFLFRPFSHPIMNKCVLKGQIFFSISRIRHFCFLVEARLIIYCEWIIITIFKIIYKYIFRELYIINYIPLDLYYINV